MIKKSRIITVLLLVALMLQVVGCSNQTGTPTTSTVAPTSASTAASTTKDYSTPQKISWAVFGDPMKDINADVFSKLYADKFNIQWDMITIPYDQWNEKIRVWANAQDMPDVAQWEYNNTDGAIYSEQGLIKKLPDDWQTKWTNVAAAFKGTGLGPILSEKFGGTYYLPRPIFFGNKPTETLVSNQGYYMRKDWMTAVGAEIKPYYTVEEMMANARLIKQKDPGKLGTKNAPIGGGVNELPQYFIYPLSTYSQNGSEYYQDADGNFQWGPAAPETLAGLKYYQQAYDEGLLTSEFFAPGMNAQENFYTKGVNAFGQAEHMAQVTLRFADNFQTSLNLKPADWLSYAFNVGLDGKYHTPEIINTWGSLMFSKDLSTEKFERVMDVIDYSSTKQGQNEIRMGIEGTDWKLDANGDLQSLLKTGETAVSKYFSIRPFYSNMYILSDDFGLINPSYPKEYRDLALNTYKTKYSLTDSTSLGKTNYDVFFYDSDARRRASFVLPDEYASLVTSKGTMDDKWNKWVTEKMKFVKPVLDEMNAKLKK